MTDNTIAEKLLVIDQRPNMRGEEKLTVFCETLSDEERQHPLGQWIVSRRDTLDWDDNIGQFLTAFWGLPRRPWVSGEQTADAAVYQQALRALMTRLGQERTNDDLV
ncbi:MAG: hypothetical protein M1596_03215 [Firmicutes bacterium]|nr:hypothetical protein [Bacillota bacterium]